MSSLTWHTYFTGTYENIVLANSKIDSNCGFPDSQTQTWAIPVQAYQQTFWFILMPPPEGYKNESGTWTQEQMISGVINVDIQESKPNWFPPF